MFHENYLATYYRVDVATDIAQLLFSKLEEMLQKTHKAEEQTASMRHKHHEILAENHELKGRLIDLRSRLMDKSVKMNSMEGQCN